MKHAGLASLVLCACAHNVPQDAATGVDGRMKGARPIALENGEGVTKGIVTYPGGDRVDWKSVQLPAGKHGTLELTMTWKAPRPGLRVAFDVFDQYSTPIQKAALQTRGHSRSTKIDHAQGTYFVRVFAPRRGDAGAYRLVASFAEDPGPVVVDTQVPEPPHLPAVPPATDPVAEDCLAFDPKNTACATRCPDDAPSTWKGCQKTCRTPDANNPYCVHSMACPTPADRRVDACMANPTKFFTACNWAAPDPGNPRCDKADPMGARIIKVEEDGGDVIITIGAGSNQHVGADWKVTVLSGASDTPLAGGTVKVFHVDRTQSKARLHLKRDLIDRNQNVRLSPP